MPARTTRVDGEARAGAHFRSMPHRELDFLDAARLPELFDASLRHDAIDLRKREPDQSGYELVWIYRLHDRRDAVPAPAPEPSHDVNLADVLVFATGHMPPMALPRLSLARFDYARFERCCASNAPLTPGVIP